MSDEYRPDIEHFEEVKPGRGPQKTAEYNEIRASLSPEVREWLHRWETTPLQAESFHKAVADARFDLTPNQFTELIMFLLAGG